MHKIKVAILALSVFGGIFASTSAVRADERCGPGKIFDRGVINCVQEFCPPTTGRNYGGICQCYNADWGGEVRVDCRNEAGLLTHCVPEGQTCDGAASLFDPTTGISAEPAPSIVPVPVGPPAGGGEIDPTKFVAINRNTEECDITDIGTVTVRTVRAPQGINIDDSVVGVAGGAVNVAGQDAEASAGDRIDVPPGYSVEVRMRGAIVNLPENARFTLPCKNEAPAMNLSGQGYFNVFDLVRPDLFRVETRNGIAGVKGTQFFVDARTDDKTTVLLEKGVVELKSKFTNEVKEIRAGERGEILNTGISTGVLSDEDKLVLKEYAVADDENIATPQTSSDNADGGDTRQTSSIYAKYKVPLVAALGLGAVALFIMFAVKRKAPKP